MLRLLNRWFRKSRTVNNEPINKVSLIVIILVDIFILINVFTGLADISQWYINPDLAYPCYSEWQSYQVQTTPDKDYQIIRDTLFYRQERPISFQKSYQENEIGHLGNVSATCSRYADYKDKVNILPNQQILTKITKNQTEIDTLKRNNANVRSQYDSTLLEKIAEQPREQSINQVAAEKAKQTIDQNNQKIAELEKEVVKSKTELLAKPESLGFIAFLKDSVPFREVESGYRQASFWYPSIQFIFQTLFLLPLILIAVLVHKVAQRKQYGLIALISWHLLVIFLIPLILKIFEFLQVGIIFQFLRNILQALFGGLLFLISYVYILLVPIFGFGMIKFFQKVVFNPKVQAAKRFQKLCCVHCGKKIREHDIYCTHCGYNQYTECPNCHNSTYQGLPFCTHCGHPQDAHS